MGTSPVSEFLTLFLMVLIVGSKLIHCTVTYDKNAIIIDGQRRILISGSIHYPRSTPDMWEDLVQKAKDGGLDVIDTYVFWNVHEPSPGNYNFEDRFDLVRFIKTVQKVGLFVHLRIGPYVCAEWNFGYLEFLLFYMLVLLTSVPSIHDYIPSSFWGFPVWLKYVPGISFRTDNGPFKAAMQGFTQKIVHMMKDERLFQSQGGPIIFSQINTCNGFYCDAFSPNKPYKPTMWTEAWSGWEPKYGHLKELHRAIKLCEHELVSSDPTITLLGTYQQAHVFSSGKGSCAAFLANYHTQSAARVMFNNMHYVLPPWSISILPDCRNVVFNTAKVGVQTSHVQMLPTGSRFFSWETYDEDISSLGASSRMTAPGLMEQINVTRDTTDYLWYITSVNINPSESFLRGGQWPTLTVESAGHALHVFINGQFSGSAFGTRENREFTFTGPVNLRAGTNRIALLSIAVGLPNVGVHYETWKTGILGPVMLHGLKQGNKDLTWQQWSYQVGLKGEAMNLVSPNSASSVDWIQGSLANRQQPLKWYKGDCSSCSYSGTFRPPKCQLGCGQPTQRWYHVPRSWLKPKQNLLVVFEELGGDASKISLVKRSTTSVCADAFEHHPAMENYNTESNGESERNLHQAKVHLRCAPGQSISAIKFASFGTPTGTCGSFQEGTCHAPNSHSVVEKECIGRESCMVAISNSNFGADPCPSKLKKLSVEAVCSTLCGVDIPISFRMDNVLVQSTYVGLAYALNSHSMAFLSRDGLGK
ncbi:hypothetical protein POTOM_020032 [Populus tomentosa]|uniref:beta-galactosidase n=1 Tax=Populus tomentosa TaxID=118781 RepID=A0A8X7ZV56_POPTO|nr:hypothetical protein POTOM_020032 [Populus tomentosa]